MFLEDSLIYFPSRYPEGDWHPAGLNFEDAWFQSADGTPLARLVRALPGRPGRRALLPRQRRQHYSSRGHLEDAARSDLRLGADLRLPRLRPQPGKAQRGGPSGRRPRRPGVAGRPRKDRRARRGADGRVDRRGRGRRSGRPRRRPGVDPGEHVHFGGRRGRVPLSLAAGPLGDADPVRFARQDRRLSRAAA